MFMCHYCLLDMESLGEASEDDGAGGLRESSLGCFGTSNVGASPAYQVECWVVSSAGPCQDGETTSTGPALTRTNIGMQECIRARDGSILLYNLRHKIAHGFITERPRVPKARVPRTEAEKSCQASQDPGLFLVSSIGPPEFRGSLKIPAEASSTRIPRPTPVEGEPCIEGKMQFRAV